MPPPCVLSDAMRACARASASATPAAVETHRWPDEVSREEGGPAAGLDGRAELGRRAHGPVRAQAGPAAERGPVESVDRRAADEAASRGGRHELAARRQPLPAPLR